VPSTRRSEEPPLARDRASASFERLRAYLARRAVLAPGEKVHIVRFAPEDWWLADSGRFLMGSPPGSSSMRSSRQTCS
jgi:hypothetical protein